MKLAYFNRKMIVVPITKAVANCFLSFLCKLSIVIACTTDANCNFHIVFKDINTARKPLGYIFSVKSLLFSQKMVWRRGCRRYNIYAGKDYDAVKHIR